MLEARIEERRRAIRTAYFNPNQSTFFAGVQGADGFALDIGLGNQKTADGFIKRYESLGYYDTGIFGTDIVTRLLFEMGRGDIACRLLTADTPHGFGAWKKEGATTFREYWGTARSHSHPMFGAVVSYFFEYLLGIRQKDDSYGYDRVLIDPAGALSVSGSLPTPHGAIAVTLEKTDGTSHLTLSLPRGIEAEIRHPDGTSRTVEGPLTDYIAY